MLAILLFSLYLTSAGFAMDTANVPAGQTITIPYLASNPNPVQSATNQDSGTQNQVPMLLDIHSKKPQEDNKRCPNVNVLENVLNLLKEILTEASNPNLNQLDKKVQVLSNLKKYIERARSPENKEIDNLDGLLQILNYKEPSHESEVNDFTKRGASIKRDTLKDENPKGQLQADVIFRYKMPSISNLDCKEALAAVVQVINNAYLQIIKHCIETGKCSLGDNNVQNDNTLSGILSLVNTKLSSTGTQNSAPAFKSQKILPLNVNEPNTVQIKIPGLSDKITNGLGNADPKIIESILSMLGPDPNKLHPRSSEVINDSTPKLNSNIVTQALLHIKQFPQNVNLNSGTNQNNLEPGTSAALPDTNNVIQSPARGNNNLEIIKLLATLYNVGTEKPISSPLNNNVQLPDKQQLVNEPLTIDLTNSAKNNAYMKQLQSILNLQKPSGDNAGTKQLSFEELLKLYKNLNNGLPQNDNSPFVGPLKPDTNGNLNNIPFWENTTPNYASNPYQNLYNILNNSPGGNLDSNKPDDLNLNNLNIPIGVNFNPNVQPGKVLNNQTSQTQPSLQISKNVSFGYVTPQLFPDNGQSKYFGNNVIMNSVPQQQKLSSPADILKQLSLLHQKKNLNTAGNPYVSNLYNVNIPSGLNLNPSVQPGKVLNNPNPQAQQSLVTNQLPTMHLAPNTGTYVNNLLDSNRLVGVTNAVKLNIAGDNAGVIELTYLLKHPNPLIYQPVYYVKYRLPLSAFETKIRQLLSQNPQMMSNPTKLYQELLASSHLKSSDLTNAQNDEIFKLIRSNGAFVNAKVLKSNDSSDDSYLHILQDLNGKLSLKEVIKLVDKEAKLRQTNKGLDKAVDKEAEIKVEKVEKKELSQNQIELSNPQTISLQVPQVNTNPLRYNSINSFVNPINLVNRIPLNVNANNRVMYNMPVPYRQMYYYPTYPRGYY